MTKIGRLLLKKVRRHEDVRMLAQILPHGGGSGTGRARDKKVRQQQHEIAMTVEKEDGNVNSFAGFRDHRINTGHSTERNWRNRATRATEPSLTDSPGVSFTPVQMLLFHA
jgi:hypothetical protein